MADTPTTPPQRSFLICKDHQHIDWNQPALEDEACILCRLFYLEAQESLLEDWQQRAKRAEDTIAEIQRPLDAQMARLNATVARLNDENEKLRAMRSETACSETSPHGLWVVWYEDPAKEHEVFFGDGSEAAARARYKSAYDNWSCHLLRRVPHGK